MSQTEKRKFKHGCFLTPSFLDTTISIVSTMEGCQFIESMNSKTEIRFLLTLQCGEKLFTRWAVKVTFLPVINNLEAVQYTEHFVGRRTSGQFEGILLKSKGLFSSEIPLPPFLYNITIDK